MISTTNIFLKNGFFLLFLFLFSFYLFVPFAFDSPVFLFLNNFLLVFILPSLVFLLGLYSRLAKPDEFLHFAFVRYFVPYLIFQFVYSAGLTGTTTWFDPLYGLWLVLALFFWHLLLPVFNELKHPFLIAFLLGISFPMIQSIGEPFAFLRTFVFFPFFILGYYAKDGHIEWLFSRKSSFVSFSCFAFTFIVLLFIPSELFIYFLTSGWNYNELQLAYVQGGLLQILTYSVMIVSSFLFFSLVPKKVVPFTANASSFIPIYLLSLGGLYLLREAGWNEQFFIWKLFLIPLIVVVLYLIANSPWLKRVSSPLTTGTLFLGIEALFIVLKRAALSFFNHKTNRYSNKKQKK